MAEMIIVFERLKADEAAKMAPYKRFGRLFLTLWQIRTILEPLPKSQWKDWALKYTLKDMKIDQMIHQHDRYFVCFKK